MNLVSKAILAAIEFDEVQLTVDELELAMLFTTTFTKETINGEVVNGVLQPAALEDINKFINELPSLKHLFSAGTVYPIFMIAKILTEVKQFTR